MHTQVKMLWRLRQKMIVMMQLSVHLMTSQVVVCLVSYCVFIWHICIVRWTLRELHRPRRATGNRRNVQCGDDSILRANGTKGRLAWVWWGASVWGVGLASCQFLCAGKYIASLIEWSGPQHPANGGVTFPGILFMTWRAQGVMNGWLLVFLSRVCCHKASWAVVRLVAFQGVRRKPCMLPPFGVNFWPCLSG